ncbi:metallophosphoesterase [Gloeobacter kilaueensis]|uniref:Metallophosphoesterase n=1 Tax=Gloeobacter kilaueensis (strain ATCC BAA-2537 / CCAP 1431/1 / ULC 316 / JS1) TaxID=1183438 RepID=U5QJI4_GLOK1|nr:metallophosphoesterase [Gloeobacter kilaueensis]AGY59081.1 metallophosphoesterase [Gloeobacter kilaueensis JS1]
MLSRRRLLVSGLIATGGATLALPAWARVEADSLKFETVPIPIVGLEAPLRVAQLSDIHWDHRSVPWNSIEQAIDYINAAEVDLVALTGDFVTYDPAPIFELAPALGRLRARHGLFAVLGNHDNAHPRGARTIKKALAREQIVLIENRWTAVASLAVGGTGDLWHGPFEPERVLMPLRGRRPLLLLSHNPDGFWRLGEQRLDLQLSGHTHGGQVRLPGVGPVLALKNRLGDRLRRYLPELGDSLQKHAIIRTNSWAGLYGQGKNCLYVSRGMGRFKRLSIGCPPEVTIIDLIPA